MTFPRIHERAYEPGRDNEFHAGRECARAALRELGVEAEVGVGAAGEPVWPAGICGSITHAAGRARAVATRRPGIGIDVEPIMDEARAWRVRDEIASGCELAAIERVTYFGLPVTTTLVFSAKETVFKCLYPQVGRYFDFHDAVVTRIEEDITVCLVTDLTPTLRAGTRLRVQFGLDAGTVMTLMLL